MHLKKQKTKLKKKKQTKKAKNKKKTKWPLLLKWLAIRHRQFDFVSD